jgi:hypothetical protein
VCLHFKRATCCPNTILVLLDNTIFLHILNREAIGACSAMAMACKRHLPPPSGGLQSKGPILFV